MKMYFKGKPETCDFYSGVKDPFFKNASNDCINHQLITKRLSDPVLLKKFKLKTKIIPDILFPRCITDMAGPPPKGNYFNIFSKPVGKNLGEKCIFGAKLNSLNSCVDFIADITRGLTRGIAILNMGNKWMKHGAIYLPNVYHILEMDNSSKAFLDNMKFETTKYEDKTNMPFKDDFSLLGKYNFLIVI